jgi:ribosomal protein L37AE/L43A
MNTLADVLKLANELLDREFTFITFLNGKHTVSARSIGYVFEFDKAKRRFGCCYYISKKITLSVPLCTENLDKVHTEIKNTLLHEIAHAFSLYAYGTRNGVGHSNFWRNIATQIGCSGERCYKREDVVLPKSKYSLVCDSCGHISPKHRTPTKSYACSKCCNEHNNGKYADKYKLRFVQNY